MNLVLTWEPQYTYKDNNLLAPVVYLAELVQTGLWAIWEEQYAKTRPASKGSYVTKLTQCQICIGYPPTSPSDLKGPGTSKLDWRYFEHSKINRNEL